MRTRINTGKVLLRRFIFGLLLIGSAAVTNGDDPSEKAASSQLIFIDGQVRLPNRFSWTNGTTLTSIIAQAQGLGDFADRERIEVISGSRTQVCSYAAALKTKSKDIVLSPGDKIYVRRSGRRTAVERMESEAKLAVQKILEGHQSSSIATVRHLKSVRSEGTLTTVTFEITNHTANTYTFFPVAVEVCNQAVWKECFNLRDNPGVAHLTRLLPPRMSVAYTWDAKDIPTNSPLRLRLDIRKTTPVTATRQNLGSPVQIVSGEFIEAGANAQGKENQQK